MSPPTDDPLLDSFEAAASGKGGEPIVLELYIAGASSRSLSATERIREFCDRHFPGRHSLAVFDLHENPELASRAHVICAPTLIKREPAPRRVLVGDLRDSTALGRALGVGAPD